MYQVLEELNKTSGISGSMVVGNDGIVIAADMDASFEEETIAHAIRPHKNVCFMKMLSCVLVSSYCTTATVFVELARPPGNSIRLIFRK